MSMNSDRYVGRATLPPGRPPVPPAPLLPAADRDRPRHPGLHWLLLVPIVLPLLTPLYNRMDPRLFGLPFFYWCQLAFVVVDVGVITLVYRLTKRRS
jgi:hypothetical protein